MGLDALCNAFASSAARFAASKASDDEVIIVTSDGTNSILVATLKCTPRAWLSRLLSLCTTKSQLSTTLPRVMLSSTMLRSEIPVA